MLLATFVNIIVKSELIPEEKHGAGAIQQGPQLLLGSFNKVRVSLLWLSGGKARLLFLQLLPSRPPLFWWYVSVPHLKSHTSD